METNGEYRKQRLLEYGAWATPGKEVPLGEMKAGDDAVSRTLGRAKIFFVFHLLRRMAGEEIYTRIMGTNVTFEPPSSWEAIKERFEKELGRDLGWFFRQWVDRKGLPDLRVEHASVRRNGSRFEISFDLFQKGDVYTLEVPVITSFLHGGSRSELVKLDAERKQVVLFVEEEPENVVIDREYDIPRRLTEAETPPLLTRLSAGDRLLLVTAATGTEAYADAVAEWRQRGAEVRQAESITDADIKSSSLLVFGSDNPLVSRLFGAAWPSNAAPAITARKNPWNGDKVVVIFQAPTARAASGAVNAVLEQGVCSTLTFDAGGTVSRRTAASDNGIVMTLREEAPVVEVPALRTLSQVIEGVSGKKIVYVGEYHGQFAHHTVQVQIIKGLFRKDPKIAIGMEMFQRPFQATLDEYIGGSIGEPEFLRRTEYFTRWGFDYNSYKPILDFARAEKIPVIALNLKREITEKVSKTGMDTLSSDERRDIPAQMDFSDSVYRDRLKQVFDMHGNAGERNFDFFYQAQVLWDEVMARSIDEYLRKNPERRMVVIAGVGHLAHGSGIPKRVYRRNGHDFATVLSDVAVEPGVADFVVFPQSLEGVTAPKIMAALKEDRGRISVADLPEGSVSKTAGIRVGDVVLSLDNEQVRNMDDIKVALFYKKQGETVRVKVKRKRFLLGDTELEFDVTLP